ncbi:MAG: hypothetical protein Q8N37_02430 [bacterium]|nr:hypothetical protein [bacterium]
MPEVGQNILIKTPKKGDIYNLIVEKVTPQDDNLLTVVGTHPAGGSRMSVTGYHVVKK